MENVKDILRENNFKFNKQFGQNFITDKNLLSAIVRDSKVTKDDVVLEIGPGSGTLTSYLCESAKRVIAFEIDTNLIPILERTLSSYDNVEVIFKDALKMDIEEIREIVGGPFHLVANLPYYITTPLVLKFLESDLDVLSYTVMVQKEVAERFVAKENTSDYGSITVAINSVANTEITRIVDRRMFYPVPNVDSAVVHISMDKNKYKIKDFSLFQRLYKCAFKMRRKTFINNLNSDFNIKKEEARNLLISMNFSESIRGEALSIEDFVKLSNKMSEMKIGN